MLGFLLCDDFNGFYGIFLRMWRFCLVFGIIGDFIELGTFVS